VPLDPLVNAGKGAGTKTSLVQLRTQHFVPSVTLRKVQPISRTCCVPPVHHSTERSAPCSRPVQLAPCGDAQATTYCCIGQRRMPRTPPHRCSLPLRVSGFHNTALLLGWSGAQPWARNCRHHCPWTKHPSRLEQQLWRCRMAGDHRGACPCLMRSNELPKLHPPALLHPGYHAAHM
jgi:hypothetical protein